MLGIKKMLIKRKLKKNVQRVQKDVRRAYRDFSKDLNKRAGSIRLPRVALSR